MQPTVNDRFAQLIQHLGLNKNAFALSLDKTASVIQHLIDGRNKPGYDLLCKVFEVYPNVSRDWIMLGQGPMMLNATENDAPTAATATPVLAAPEIPSETTVPEEVLAQPVPPAETKPEKKIVEKQAPEAAIPTPIPTALAVPESTSTPAATVAPVTSISPDAYVTAALHTQHLQHQLALAEMRNQFLLEQQQMLRQMLEMAQRG